MRIIPFVLALGLAVGGWAVPSGAPAAAPVDEGTVSLVAAPAFSGVVRAGQALQVTGTVTNSTAQVTDAGAAAVYLPSTGVPDRESLAAWLDSEDGSAGVPLGDVLGSTAIGELAPGQVRAFAITIPAEDLPAMGTSMTTRPLAVRLAAGSVEVDFARTAIVWLPSNVPNQVALTVVAPFVTPPGATGLLGADELAELTAPDGLLTLQLDMALAHPVAIGIDPMILASIRLLGTTAPQSALAWLAALEAAPNDIFPLGYADADPALASHAGMSLPVLPLGFPIDATLFPVPPAETPAPDDTPAPTPDPQVPTPETLLAWDYSVDGIAWPAESTVEIQDLGSIADAGYSRILLDSAQVDMATSGSPNVTIAAGEGGAFDATLLDDTVSRLLQAAAMASTDAEAHAATTAAGAYLALAASQGDVTLVAALGRDGSASALRLDAVLSSIESMPWVTMTGIVDALAVPSTAATFTPMPQPEERLATARTLVQAEQAVTAFSSVVDDPTLLTAPRRLALLALLAESWSFDQAGWASATRAHLDEGTSILDSVRIPQGTVINFPLEKGNLPIAVTNDLDFPVTVYVTVQPARAILDVLDDRVELKIEANSQSKASVPVQSIANGEVRTTVRLESSTGIRISTAASVDLNVQAGWETAATVVLAIIVVLLFGAGVARSVLRWRKRKARDGLTDETEPAPAESDTMAAKEAGP